MSTVGVGGGDPGPAASGAVAEPGLPARLPVFGVGISASSRYEEIVSAVVERARLGRPLALTALSVHGLMLAAEDAEMAAALARMDVVTTDGQPVRWAVNALHRTQLSQRISGPELMLRTCAAAERERLPIFLYGSRPAVILKLRDRLRGRFPRLAFAGVEPSRVRPRRFPPPTAEPADFDDVERIRESGAALVFVGLGCPLQELWVAAHREHLGMPALCVGAAFDFHAGLLPRAPDWMQARGLEWLYRLAREPRRLWRRYLLHNPAYLARLAVELAARRR